MFRGRVRCAKSRAINTLMLADTEDGAPSFDESTQKPPAVTWIRGQSCFVVSDQNRPQIAIRGAVVVSHRSLVRTAIYRRSFTMSFIVGILAVFAAVQITMCMVPIKDDHLMTELLLRDLIDRMGNELAEAADSYLEYQDVSQIPNDYDKAKEIPDEMPIDYEGIETLNPNPSIRDQEYVRHSSLGSLQRLNGNGDSGHRIQPGGCKGVKDEKTENNLPAYCTPPNPCPIGYSKENHCIEDFENTAAFSRDFQSAQDCMCDTEHMVHCPTIEENNRGLPSVHMVKSDFERIVEQFQDANPYFQGEKLPIAAKKGIHVIF